MLDFDSAYASFATLPDLEERITVGLRIRNDRVAKIRKCKYKGLVPPKDGEKRLLPRFIAIFILTQQRGKNRRKYHEGSFDCFIFMFFCCFMQ
jgi:hypothetical protein